MSLLIPNRTVLLVSDEALYVYTLKARGVRLIDTVPWSTENFSTNVARILNKDGKNKPVLILYDMVEQHYRKEKVVKKGVSIMDKSTMLKRRLQVAFPNYPVRAALPLKEKMPAGDGKKPASDIYIFAAVPKTEAFRLTMQAIKTALVSIVGFSLLPVEASDMVKALTLKNAKKGQPKSTWSIFIGQHRNGSLRQVVTKNGELALTRMSPVTESDNPHQWAEDVHQEFKATMSYLSRFGYAQTDGLDVTIISTPESAEVLRNIIEEPCNLNIMGVGEAAKKLGLSIGFQDSQKYADPLHVAWIGKKSKFILPMKASEIDEVSAPRNAAVLITLALCASGAYFGYQAYTHFSEILQTSEEIQIATTRKTQLDSQYQREVERKKQMGFDVQLVQSSITVYENFEKDRIPALDVFKQIGTALGKDLRIDKLSVEKTASNALVKMIPGQDEQAQYQLRLSMTYPGTTDIDRGNQEVQALSEKIAALLPTHAVKVTKLLKDYEYTEGLVVETGDLETENLQQDFVAEIMISGPAPVKEETSK